MDLSLTEFTTQLKADSFEQIFLNNSILDSEPQANKKIQVIDFFKLEQIEKNLQKVDRVYFVEFNPIPTAQLDQGDVVAYQRLIRENFISAAKKFPSLEIIYPQIVDNQSQIEHYKKPLKIKNHLVRSIQFYKFPIKQNARWYFEDYIHWLPCLLFPFLKIRSESGMVIFSLIFKKLQLLKLQRNQFISSEDCEIYSIKGGILAKFSENARFEFRITHAKDGLITALHEFKPALPWPIYRISQALIHSLVMKAYGRHLKNRHFK